MITSRWFKDEEEIDEIINFRKKYFDIKEKDLYDRFSFNLGIFEEEKLVGIGRLTCKGEDFYIDYIAVDKNCRRKGYGDFILRILIRKAYDIGLKEIYAETEENNLNFFERLGFKKEKSKNNKILLSRKGDISGGCCG